MPLSGLALPFPLAFMALQDDHDLYPCPSSRAVRISLDGIGGYLGKAVMLVRIRTRDTWCRSSNPLKQ